MDNKYFTADDLPQDAGLSTGTKTQTQQNQKDETDINLVMARYGVVGVANMPGNREIIHGLFGDFSEIGDFQTAQNKVIAAQNAFNALPAKLRARFQNDPQQFIQFFEDPSNRKEAIELGLIDNPQPNKILTDAIASKALAPSQQVAQEKQAEKAETIKPT